MSVSSQSLLSEFVANRSERAFGEIVADQMPLVYSTALRRTNHASGIAQEVAQDVFTRLARKADSLPEDVCLSAWLYRQTCRIAASSMRGETRRLKREAIATDFMNDVDTRPESQLIVELDEAMTELPESSREVLVLRFLVGQNHRSVGDILGVSEEAARKRADRALNALRDIFEKRGLRVSTPVVVVALTGLKAKTLPAATIAQVSSQALKAPVVKLGLSTTLTGILVGMMGVSAVAGGVLLTRKSSARVEESLVQRSDRSRPSDRNSEGGGDLITRIKRICDGPSNILGEIRLFALLEEVDDRDIPAFVESSAVFLDRAEREICYQHLLKRWMNSDPVGAMDYAVQSKVSLLIKYENADSHDKGPDENFLYFISSPWLYENLDKASDWLVKNHDIIEEIHGRTSLEIMTRNFLRGIGQKKGVQGELEFSSRMPLQRQADLLKMIFCVGHYAHQLKIKDIPVLLEHLPGVSDPILQGELRNAVWTGWAGKEPRQMLSQLENMEGEEVFQARLALLGRINPLGEVQQFAGGHQVHVFDGKPFSTVEERERDALKAGVAVGLTGQEALQEIIRWYLTYGDYGTSDRVGKLLGKIEGPHHLDGTLEDGIGAKLSPEKWDLGWGSESYHSEAFKLALMIEDDVRRREIARAVFRGSMGFNAHGRWLLEGVDPADPLHAELEAMMNPNQQAQ